MVGVDEAVCRKHVGLARRTDLAVVSVAGLGPEIGRAVRVGAAWNARVGPERVLVIAPGVSADGIFSVVGPRASALLVNAGLPADLTPGVVRVCWWLGAFAVVLCEREDRYLVVGGTWDALLVAGLPLEVARVGVGALSRLDAARL